MKLVLVVVAAAVVGSLVTVVSMSFFDATGSGFDELTSDEGTDFEARSDVADLRDDVAGMRRRLERLERDARGSTGAGADRVPRVPSAAPSSGSISSTDIVDQSRTREFRWYLERYERSFDDHSSGSEYFRLAVEAHIVPLFGDVVGRAGDSRAVEPFRIALLKLLAHGRFQGDPTAIGVMVDILSSRTSSPVATAALAVLDKVGDRSTAASLEGIVWQIEDTGVRRGAIQLLVRLDPDNVNRALHRLLVSARDRNWRVIIVSMLSPSDSDGALAAFEDVVTMTQPVRLAAATRIGVFRAPAFVDFVATWIDRETDPAVRKALGAARDRQKKIPNYHPMRTAGPPNARLGRDDVNAWATRSEPMGRQWLELTYEKPQTVHTIRIIENCAPGAVAEVITIDPRGTRRTVWQGNDPTTTAGAFDVRISETSYPVAAVRVVIDTNRRRGWNEIDAVEIVGSKGRAWASRATASSYYQDRQ